VNTEKRRARTVKVTIHIGQTGSYAVGIITSEWQGSVRLDRRLARAHPMPDDLPPPPGVNLDVWRAFLALSDLITTHRTDV
jgi:hypothetical protein